MSEFDPFGKKNHEPGAKMDAGKPSVWRGLLDYFPRACMKVSEVSTVGAKKYTWKGWESVPEGVERYADAGARHILLEAIEGPLDADTGLLHKAQKAWNALAELELYLRKNEYNAKHDPVYQPSKYEPTFGAYADDMAKSGALSGSFPNQQRFGVDGDKLWRGWE